MGFIPREPTLEDYWRGIILFGRNVASYKFALAKALLELKPASGQLIKLTELAPVFAGHIATHLLNADKQGSSSQSKFLEACRSFNKQEIDKDKLTDQTVRLGFNNVIDAFHVVGQSEVQKRFYIDERSENGGIRITDEFSSLMEGFQSNNLEPEVEARWCLVERAWELGVSRGLLSIDYDDEAQLLFSLDKTLRRKPLTSVRGALNGYQKGRCFYCFTDISISGDAHNTDVDHFFPHKLKQSGFGSLIDGVWNLVLSCAECNRGTSGKFGRMPKPILVQRLCNRNEYLIESHHPLRETIMLQTGNSVESRKQFLRDFLNRIPPLLLKHEAWEPEPKAPRGF
jgi:hypothetical protein